MGTARFTASAYLRQRTANRIQCRPDTQITLRVDNRVYRNLQGLDTPSMQHTPQPHRKIRSDILPSRVKSQHISGRGTSAGAIFEGQQKRGPSAKHPAPVYHALTCRGSTGLPWSDMTSDGTLALVATPPPANVLLAPRPIGDAKGDTHRPSGVADGGVVPSKGGHDSRLTLELACEVRDQACAWGKASVLSSLSQRCNTRRPAYVVDGVLAWKTACVPRNS